MESAQPLDLSTVETRTCDCGDDQYIIGQTWCDLFENVDTGETRRRRSLPDGAQIQEDFALT